MYKMLFIMAMVTFAVRSSAQTKLPLPDKLPEKVGDITFDPKLDDPHFVVCHSDNIYQYYELSTTYKGGTKAIKNFFFNNFKYQSAYSKVTGYITIRFVVNCKGQTGWFRIQQLNSRYEHAQFNNKIVATLLDLTKKLNQWIPGKGREVDWDTYYYLNFKLINGHLKEITP
jgi:hypothetical protein